MAFGKEDFVLTETMKGEIKNIALQNPDEETCGFILKDGSVVECPNTFYNSSLDERSQDELIKMIDWLQIRDIPAQTEPDEMRRLISLKTGMAISARDRLAYEDAGIAAVWHSHCLDSSPGYLSYEDILEHGVVSDITQSKLQRLPFVLYHTRFNEWDWYSPYELSPYPLQRPISNPKNINEYVGLPYTWNRADCLEIPRAVMWGMFGINLGIHTRTSPDEYVREGWARYVQGFPEVGFEEVTMFPTMRFKAGDCLLMQLPGYHCLHHLGVCVDEKHQTMIHIVDGRVSEIDAIAKFRRYVRVTFRHQKFR